MFHTSLLIPHRPNTIANCKQPPPPPTIIDDKEEYEVESIIRKRNYKGQTQHLVKWLGYPLDEEKDWYHHNALKHAQDVLSDFLVSPNNKTHKKRRYK